MSKSPDIIARCDDIGDLINISFKKVSDRYLDEFVRMKCSPDLLALKVFPNAKEITESMGAFNAVRNFLKAESFGNRNIHCYVVADGHSPRTGALMAFLTRWKVFSIDPELRQKGIYKRIERLTILNQKVQDIEVELSNEMNVILAVHSHAKFPIMWNKIGNKPKVGIAIPCCVKQEIDGLAPAKEYYDWGIHSPKRLIKIWDGRQSA